MRAMSNEQSAQTERRLETVRKCPKLQGQASSLPRTPAPRCESRALLGITARNKLADQTQFSLTRNRVRLHKLMPLDVQPGRLQNIDLLAHLREGNERVF